MQTLRTLPTVLLSGAIAALTAFPALAQIQYTSDGFRDGVTNGIVGNGAAPGFELFGAGHVQQGNRLIVGISSHMPFGGFSSTGVQGGSITWGDLFLNFSPDDDFETALAAGKVYGVRFNPFNDSPVALGVYQVTGTASVASVNQGFASVNAYINHVTAAGQTPYFGTTVTDSSFNYLNRTKSNNVIASGHLLSTDVEYIQDLTTLGFASDFGFGDNLAQTGAYTHGLSFSLDSLPGGRFLAHFWAECINDGMAFRGELQAVPEPSMLLGFASLGMLALATGKRRPS